MSKQARWAAVAVALCLFLAVFVWSTVRADAAPRKHRFHNHPHVLVHTTNTVVDPPVIIIYNCGGTGGGDVWPPPEECPGQHLPKTFRNAG